MATTTPNGGWPDATNTGVPPGVILTPSGDLVITQAGTVISGLNITGTVTIEAPNVTLENCKITSGGFFLVNIVQGVTGAVVQNCEINGLGLSGSPGSCGINGQGTFLNNNIYNVENPINISGSSTGSSVIQGNYIHGLLAPGSPHYDGIQIDGAVSNITIEHNTIINDQGQVSAIMIDNGYGAVSNISVDNNLLSGGDFTVYDDAHFNSSTITGVSFTNNHMGAGTYGYTDFNGTSPTYTGNVNDAATLIATLNTPANDGGSGGTTSLPAVPVIASFSPDTGVVGDGITNANKLDLKGTADSNSTITVYDGSTKLGTTTASSTGSWDYITSVLTNAKHVLTATETNTSGQTSAASAALTVTVDTHVPAAPVLVSDPMVNINHVQLSGTAEANSTITVYDGTTVVGTGTTSSTGSWSVTTGALPSGTHALTATATDVAGTVSAMSQPLDPVIGAAPTPPAAPHITSFSPDTGVVGDGVTDANMLTLTGTAVANSTVQVFDGTTQVGTATAGSTGAWTLSTTKLADGSHSLTATDTVSGVTSAASSPLSVTVDTHVPAAPVLVSDSVVNTNHVLLSGTAEANSAITVYDGTTAVGTATTGANGTWSVTTVALASGTQALTATATDVAGNTSVLSHALDPVIPTTTVISAFGSTSLVEVGNNFYLNSISGGSGPELKYAGAAVVAGQYGAWAPIGVEQTATGYEVAWKVTGADQYGVWNTDGSGNYVSNIGGLMSGTSTTLESLETSFHQDLNGDGVIGIPATVPAAAPASAVGFTNLSESSSGIVTLTGTADAASAIQILDGTNVVGMVTSANDGTWSFTSSSAVSNTLHTYKAQELDSTGHVVATSSGAAIMAASNTSTLSGTGGNDFLFSSSSNVSDTFVFAASFGNSTIEGFTAGSGSGHDVIQFSKSVFDSFATVLSHASQVGQDVVISSGSETLKLKNTALGALNSQDFHFA